MPQLNLTREQIDVINSAMRLNDASLKRAINTAKNEKIKQLIEEEREAAYAVHQILRDALYQPTAAAPKK